MSAKGYNAWLSMVTTKKDQELTPLRQDPKLEESAPEEAMASISFLGFRGQMFDGEVGKKKDDLIYHFFFKSKNPPPQFEEKMGDAFLSIFKFPEKISAAFSEELNSWAVLVKGYAANPLAEKLSGKLFFDLDRRLES